MEMIPYWLGHCRALIAATAEPPVFGRGYDAPERLAGIERGSNGDPKELLGLLNDEVKAAARAIRQPYRADTRASLPRGSFRQDYRLTSFKIFSVFAFTPSSASALTASGDARKLWKALRSSTSMINPVRRGSSGD